jgi:hypothetical protein
MTPEHSHILVTLDKSFKNSVGLENELPHSHPLTHSLSHFRIIVTPRCSKINSSIKPAPASGLDLWGQPVTVTADVRSTISKLSVPFPTCFTHHCAIMTHLHWRFGTCFSVQATGHTMDVFVGPKSRCRWISTYRTNSIWSFTLLKTNSCTYFNTFIYTLKYQKIVKDVL